MNWLTLAFLPPVFWGLANIIDKFLMTKVFEKPIFFLVWIGIGALPICALIYFISDISFNLPYTLLALAIGFFWGIFNFIYAKTLMIEEISRTISLIFITPIFVTLLAGIFLNEHLDVFKYIGIILLVVSALLLSYKKEKKRFVVIKSLNLILTLILMWTFLQIAEKFTVDRIGYWSLYFWATFGVFLTVLPILFIRKIRAGFINSLIKNRRSFLVLIIGEILVAIGSISFYAAIALGPLSIISAIISLQPFFVFIYTLLASIFIPRILKEEINKQNILMKSAAVILVIAGTWLLV